MSRTVEQFLASLLLIIVLLGIAFYRPTDSGTTASGSNSSATLKPIQDKNTYSVPQFNPSLIISTSTLESIFPTLRATTTVIKKRKFPVITIAPPKRTPKKTVVAIAPTPVPTVQPVTQTVPVTEPVAADTSITAPLKRSVVNILCTSHTPTLRGVSGSGVIIDSQGIILTVAHVAQAELLSEALGNNVISCSIRTGNPARDTYKAKLIYISEPWLKRNSTTLISSQPMGTGENDFALLAIRSSADGRSLPSSFPSVPLTEATQNVGDEVGIGGYGAQYLTSTQVRNSLSPTFVTGSIDDVFTFRTNSQDVLSILGNKAAQEGSSGGGVVNSSGRFIGLITTSEISGDFSTRHLRVITPTHIRNSFESDKGESISSYLGSASASVLVSNYAPKVTELGDFLARAIGQR